MVRKRLRPFPALGRPLRPDARLRVAHEKLLGESQRHAVYRHRHLRHETAGRHELLPTNGGKATGVKRDQDADLVQLLYGRRILEDIQPRKL